MKKINKFTAVLILPFLMILNSCMDPIFYEIRKDVKPEKATVSGNISSITRFTGEDGTEYLYTAADKGLRRKLASNQKHDSWSVQSIPFDLIHFDFESTSFEGEQILSVLANEDTLFLISVPYITTGTEGNTNPSTVHLWAKKNGASWKKIDFPFRYSYNYDEGKWENKFRVCQTNSPIKAHRHAYISTNIGGEYKYYELDASKSKYEDSDAITVTIEDGTAGECYINSAVWFEGKVKFFKTGAAVTNETYKTDPTKYYYSDGKDLKYSDGKETKKALSADRTISALATCKDSILIGLGDISGDGNYGGINRAGLDKNGVPASSTSGFASNASFQISASYIVLTLLNATPDKTERQSALYSSITYSGSNGLADNVGLWSYYPDRDNWNRE